MNMFNRLPYFVVLQEREYKINADFRNMIFFENKLQDRNVDRLKKIEYGLRHFYPDFFNIDHYKILIQIPELYQEACDQLVWFYKCGRDDYHKIKNTGKGRNKQIYSYEFDDEYIYGAFYEQYGIDLAYDKVHWWKFKSLLKSLKDDTEFVKIQGYRGYSGEDKNMLELRDYWELPKPIDEQQRLNNLYESLK